MPEVQGRRICAPRNFTRTRCRPHFLRLQPLSRLRFHHAARAAQRAVPEMRRALHRRKAHQARKFPHLHQGRLRLGNRSARTARRRNRNDSSRAASLSIRVARREFRSPTRTRDRRGPRQTLSVAQPLLAAHARRGRAVFLRTLLPLVVVLSAAQGSLFALYGNDSLADFISAGTVSSSGAPFCPGVAHASAPSATITGKHSIT